MYVRTAPGSNSDGGRNGRVVSYVSRQKKFSSNERADKRDGARGGRGGSEQAAMTGGRMRTRLWRMAESERERDGEREKSVRGQESIATLTSCDEKTKQCGGLRERKRKRKRKTGEAAAVAAVLVGQ